MKTSWDWLKIGSHGGSWQPTYTKKTAPDDDDITYIWESDYPLLTFDFVIFEV